MVEDNKRFFIGPEEKKYFIEDPTADDIRGAEWQYSKTYTQCLIEGITTSSEMMDILTRRGIIGPEFEQRALELTNELATNINLLDTTDDLDIKRELALKVAGLRDELYTWNQRLNGPMNNTAEQISDDAKLEYLTSVMIIKENGDKVWNSYNDYLKEKDQRLATQARYQVMLFLQGLNSDFLDNTPEAIAMREVEEDMLSKAHALLNEDNAADDIEDTPKKKKATKKK